MSISVAIIMARGLTLARLAGIPLFAGWLLRAEPGAAGAAMFACYVFFPLSDYVDGPLARWAGGEHSHWGRLDAFADIAFNAATLLAVARTGWVGYWVPASVAVLGARFLWRGPEAGRDPLGKAAGVIFYFLTGAAVAGTAFGGGRWWIARAGDVVSLYALIVFLRGLGGGRRGPRTPSGGR